MVGIQLKVSVDPNKMNKTTEVYKGRRLPTIDEAEDAGLHTFTCTAGVVGLGAEVPGVEGTAGPSLTKPLSVISLVK